MLPSMSMPNQRFRGVGRCIYCLAALPDDDLTDEHIIPLALCKEGEIVFAKASCLDCARELNKTLDQPMLQNEFRTPRLLLDLKRRKKREVRPLLPVALGNNLHGPSEAFDTYLSPDQHPPAFMFMMWHPPGLIEGIDRSDFTTMQVRMGTVSLAKDARQMTIQATIASVPAHPPVAPFGGYEVVEPSSFGGVTMQVLTDFDYFPRAIAKIGYAYGIAKLGLDALDYSGVQRVVMGDAANGLNYVGFAEEGEAAKLTQRHLHKLYLRLRGEYVTVLVHLFASWGVPPYEVVLGKVKPGQSVGAISGA